jgi:rRNA maturation endonuclease Nob1
MVKKECKDCGKEFETTPHARYPRKFCDKCSKKRKKDYENIHSITADECEE